MKRTAHVVMTCSLLLIGTSLVSAAMGLMFSRLSMGIRSFGDRVPGLKTDAGGTLLAIGLPILVMMARAYGADSSLLDGLGDGAQIGAISVAGYVVPKKR